MSFLFLKKGRIKFLLYIIIVISIFTSLKFYALKNYILSINLILISLFALFMYFSNKNKSDIYLNYNYLDNTKIILAILKILNIFVLVVLAQYFLYNKQNILGYITYIISYIQAILLFRFRKIEKIKTSSLINSKNIPTRKNFLLFVLFCLLITFLIFTFDAAIKEKMGNFILFFVIASGLLYKVSKLMKTENMYEYKKIDKNDFILLIFIGTLSSVLRVYKLLEVPPGIINDFVVVLNVFEQAKQGIDLPMYIGGVYAQATLIAKFLGFISNLFKFEINIFTVKLFHAIVGVINIVFLYLLIREIYSKRMAFISSFILSFMTQHLLFSRSGEAMILTMASLTICFYFYFLALRKGNSLLMVIAGIWLGISIYFYTPGRAAPFIFVLYWLFLLFWGLKNNYKKYIMKMNLILVISSIIAFIPLMDYIIKYPNVYFERIKQFNLIGFLLRDKNCIESIVAQIYIYYKFFFNEGCEWGLYNLTNQAAFDVITNILFILGFIYLLINWKSINNIFIICWFFIGILIGFLSGTATFYPARIILIYPVVAVIAGTGLDLILRFIEYYGYKFLMYTLLFIILTILSVFNVYRYFYKYPNDPSVKYANNSYYNKIRIELEKHKGDDVLFSNFYLIQSEGGILMNYLKLLKINGRNMDISLSEFSKIYNNKNKNVIILAEGIYDNSYVYFKQYFRNLTIYRGFSENYFLFISPPKFFDMYGWKRPELVTGWLRNWYFGKKTNQIIPLLDFVYFRIPYEDIRDLYRLNVTFISGSNRKNLFFGSNSIIYLSSADYAEINNLIEIPDYDSYRFLVKNSRYEVYIDNILVKKQVTLYKGLHKIKIKIFDIANNKEYILFWKRGNGEFEPIPVNYFIDSDKIFGLVAYYKNDENKIVYESLESMMQFNNYFYFRRPGIKCPGDRCNVTWKGYLEVIDEDSYEIYFETDRYSEVIVDNKIVSIKAEYGKPEIKNIYLKNGKHKIEINSVAAQVETPIRLLWKKRQQKFFYPVASVNLTPFVR